MKTFDTNKFKLIVHDNLVKELILKAGQELLAEDVWNVLDLSLKEKPGAKFYTLFLMEAGSFISKETRLLTLTEKYIQHHEAIAYCSNDENIAIDTAVFDLTHKQKIPFHFFDDREKAWTWLQGLAECTWRNFETPAFTLTIHDDLIKELYVKDGVELSVADLKLSLDMSDKYKPGARFYMVLYEGEGSSISMDARRAAGTDEYEKHTAAVAICSEELDVEIRGKMFEKVFQPRIPFHFFDDRDKAINWLRSLMKKN